MQGKKFDARNVAKKKIQILLIQNSKTIQYLSAICHVVAKLPAGIDGIISQMNVITALIETTLTIMIPERIKQTY